MPRRRSASLLLATLVLLAAAAAGALEVPYLGGRVNDLAGMLSDGFESRLESRLEQLERDTSSQVVVLTIPSLEGDSIEDFAMRAAETWKLGHQGVDNGVLVVIARDERLVRIEVGYGLEGALTDAESGRIIRGLMTPRFRAGDFDGGVEAAVDAIDAKVRGEPITLPESRPGGGQTPGLGTLLLFAIFGLPFINAAIGARGAAGWILYLILAPFFFVIPAAFFGVPVGAIAAVAWLVGFPILRAILPRRPGPPSGPSARGRGGHPPIWIGGPGRSGGFGGGGFSGGGFGGFGGSFGGGGATGGW